MCDHSPNREAAMVVIRSDEAGRATVWCDPCLEPLVRALNDGGLQTLASCCGHGRRPGNVVLADGRVLMVFASIEATDVTDGLWPDINASPPPVRPNPSRPNPSIVGDPLWGSPRCVVCGGYFHGGDMVVANRWLFWRRWRRRFRHEQCTGAQP